MFDMLLAVDLSSLAAIVISCLFGHFELPTVGGLPSSHPIARCFFGSTADESYLVCSEALHYGITFSSYTSPLFRRVTTASGWSAWASRRTSQNTTRIAVDRLDFDRRRLTFSSRHCRMSAVAISGTQSTIYFNHRPAHSSTGRSPNQLSQLRPFESC